MNSLHFSAIQDMNIWDAEHCLYAGIAPHATIYYTINTEKKAAGSWSDQQTVSYCYVWSQIM